MLSREKVPEGPSVFHVVAELVPCGTSPCMVFGCLSAMWGRERNDSAQKRCIFLAFALN